MSLNKHPHFSDPATEPLFDLAAARAKLVDHACEALAKGSHADAPLGFGPAGLAAGELDRDAAYDKLVEGLGQEVAARSGKTFLGKDLDRLMGPKGLEISRSEPSAFPDDGFGLQVIRSGEGGTSCALSVVAKSDWIAMMDARALVAEMAQRRAKKIEGLKAAVAGKFGNPR